MTPLQRHTKTMFEHFEKLYAPEKKVFVPGEGAEGVTLALVGEAPGAREVQQMRPFVGKAGSNLDRLFEVINLAREKVYITNVVKFRPVKVSEKGTQSNRTPTAEEIALWTPWLRKELKLCGAPIVVTLGNVALRALSGEALTIGKVHGKPIKAQAISTNAVLFPLYHPASLIYNRKLIETFEEDLLQLKVFLEG